MRLTASGSVAYLVLSHQQPSLVEALVDRILTLSSNGQVVLHHDLAAETVPWEGSAVPERVHLVERSRLAWGDWSIVEATLRLMLSAVDDLGAEWMVVISGTHWPVIDLAAWEDELRGSAADAWVPARPLPDRLRFGVADPDGNEFLARSVHRWRSWPRPRSDALHRLWSGIFKASRYTHPAVKLEFSLSRNDWFLGTPRRRGPVRGWTLYKGSQWIALNRRAAGVVLDTDPAVIRWYSRSHIPDESYIPTLLHRSAELVVENRIVTHTLSAPPAPREEWNLLKRRDLPAVWESGAAFARKVDPEHYPSIMRALDEEVDRRRGLIGARAGVPVAPAHPTFAYLALTHLQAAQVEAMVGRVLELSPAGQVVLHHDLSSPTLPYGGRPPARVSLLERRALAWGDWSIVDAMLRATRFAADRLDADWFVFLSGEHWPVVDLDGWERRLAESGADALVDAEAVPERLRFGRSQEDGNRFRARCAHRWVTFGQPGLPGAHRAVCAAWKLQRYVQPLVGLEYSHRRQAWFVGLPRPQGRMRGWTFYKGSQWIAFNRRAAEAILETDPAVTKWFRSGHIADETYFATVLRHHPELVVLNQTVTYFPPGPERPVEGWEYLTPEHLPAVRAAGAAFARKADPTRRPEVLAVIDAEVDRQRRENRADAVMAVAGEGR